MCCFYKSKLAHTKSSLAELKPQNGQQPYDDFELYAETERRCWNTSNLTKIAGSTSNDLCNGHALATGRQCHSSGIEWAVISYRAIESRLAICFSKCCSTFNRSFGCCFLPYMIYLVVEFLKESVWYSVKSLKVRPIHQTQPIVFFYINLSRWIVTVKSRVEQ